MEKHCLLLNKIFHVIYKRKKKQCTKLININFMQLKGGKWTVWIYNKIMKGAGIADKKNCLLLFVYLVSAYKPMYGLMVSSHIWCVEFCDDGSHLVAKNAVGCRTDSTKYSQARWWLHPTEMKWESMRVLLQVVVVFFFFRNSLFCAWFMDLNVVYRNSFIVCMVKVVMLNV